MPQRPRAKCTDVSNAIRCYVPDDWRGIRCGMGALEPSPFWSSIVRINRSTASFASASRCRSTAVRVGSASFARDPSYRVAKRSVSGTRRCNDCVALPRQSRNANAGLMREGRPFSALAMDQHEQSKADFRQDVVSGDSFSGKYFFLRIIFIVDVNLSDGQCLPNDHVNQS